MKLLDLLIKLNVETAGISEVWEDIERSKIVACMFCTHVIPETPRALKSVDFHAPFACEVLEKIKRAEVAFVQEIEKAKKNKEVDKEVIRNSIRLFKSPDFRYFYLEETSSFYNENYRTAEELSFSFGRGGMCASAFMLPPLTEKITVS